jgi:hypothetical protein
VELAIIGGDSAHAPEHMRSAARGQVVSVIPAAFPGGSPCTRRGESRGRLAYC